MFTNIANPNTITRVETRALLFAGINGNDIVVNTMLFPKQQGRSDYWSASDNAEITAFD